MIIIFKTIKTYYEISFILNFSTNTILWKIQFRSKLYLTVISLRNTNSVPVSWILYKTPVERPVKQLLHPSWVAKVRPENFHLELPLGAQDLCMQKGAYGSQKSACIYCY